MSAAFDPAEVTAALGREPAALPDPTARFARVGIDSRRTLEDDLFVAICGDRHDGHDHLAEAVAAGATGVVVAEDQEFAGRDRTARWEVEDGRRALQALAAFHRRRLPARVVGITGSNGKTTTKELVAAVLSQRFRTARTSGNLNNQVGVPLTLLEIGPEHEWAVVELGTNQPGEIGPLARISDPEIGVLTNVAASHLEGLGTMEAVLEEKMALAHALGPGDLLIYCGDQAVLRESARGLPCRTLSYGFGPGNDLRPEAWSLDDEGRGSFSLDGRTYRLRLVGRHNVVNGLAAVAVGLEAGLASAEIAGGLAEPGMLPMRMQLERWGAVTALVDCYNANPESVRSAASTLAGLGGARRRIAVLGEMLELGVRSAELHAEVGSDVASAVDVVVAVGPGAAAIADGARGADGGNPPRAERFDSREEAAEWLVAHLRPGDAVLFKASRGAELERVVAAVRDACLDGSAAGAPARGGG
ncbi:MAG TPA: UDP-N-acetylmuramoyl-tripeptide--D-alanyl-D-alanine ligase [Gemmatimonadota bacterium]|nr:UDP-N-acetylmuramoyl-tripeptide--D-alanyl-D-alanine ligase [Gemmatimonadota bacterium]